MVYKMFCSLHQRFYHPNIPSLSIICGKLILFSYQDSFLSVFSRNNRKTVLGLLAVLSTGHNRPQ